MSRTISTLLAGRAFLECPRWHDGRIWASDFYTHEVLSCTEDGGDLRVEAEIPTQPSGLGWLPDGRLLVVSMADRRLLRRESDGAWAVHADLADEATGPLNELVVDEAGRAYVGCFGFDLMGGAPFAPASLLRVDPDGGVAIAAGDLWFPNGMAITDDGVLIVAETFGNRVSAFDLEPDGALSGRRTWARFGEVPSSDDVGVEFPQLTVAPDGGCLDAEGAMWIADAAHGRALRVREGGEILDEVSPGAGVFACMLGGLDRRTLFLCSAPDFDARARSAARDGRLLAVRVPVAGAGRP